LELERRLAPGRQVQIPVAPGVQKRVLKDLPAEIEMRPGELRIEFGKAEELLRRLFELSQAVVNDYERFEKLVEGAK